jgi:predicted short-subunit dehydrogenase-like oxidoreductase (DUF2520 family)
VKVFVIGPGRVGTALARALAEAGEEVLALHGRPPFPVSLARAEAVIVAVPDAAVGEVATALAGSTTLSPEAVVVHTAGALGPSALAPAHPRTVHTGTFHPLQTFPVKGQVPSFDRVPFAIAGEARARAAAARLAARLGGVAIEVPEERRALYHAAAVLACGHVTALAAVAARALAVAAGTGEREALSLLGPILRTTAENLAVLGLPAAMTGPAARGDEATIARHVAALQGVDPRIAELYRALVEAAR